MRSDQLNELITAFERHLRCECGYKRSDEYASRLRMLANFLAGSGRTLLEITAEDLTAFRASRPSQASATFRNGLSALRGFFSWLKQNSYSGAVPILASPKLAVTRLSLPEDALCSKKPAGSLETHARSFLPGVLNTLLYDYRLLRSEILAVNVGDVNLDRGTIRIGSTERRSDRSIALAPDIRELLRRYLIGERGLGSPAAWEAEADRPVFLNVNGGALSRQQFAECLRWSQGVRSPVSRVELAPLRFMDAPGDLTEV